MAASYPIDDLSEKLRAVTAEAYERGFRDGVQAMKAAVTKADVQPLSQAPETQAAKPRHLPPVAPARARPLVLRVLTEKPGSAIIDLQDTIKTLDPDLSPNSIASELHRQNGKLYRKEGRRWYALASAQNGVAAS